MGQNITWKPPATQVFAPPWNPERFAELDICIIRNRWKNTVTNVQSDIRTNIDSDHIALHVNIRQKLKKLAEDTPDNSLTYIKLIGTTETQAIQYQSNIWNEQKYTLRIQQTWVKHRMHCGKPQVKH